MYRKNHASFSWAFAILATVAASSSPVIATPTISIQSDTTTSSDSTQLWLDRFVNLDEIVVKADLPKVQVNADGIKITIGGTALEKVGTAKDLMTRLPGVKGADDGVEIFGRGIAEVYINGRRLYDPGELDQLSSDQIANVEIITSPGSRYAATTKAVVRIRTKRSAGEGWGVRNRLMGAATRWGVGGSNQTDVNFRSGGLDVAAMLKGQFDNGRGSVYEFLDTYVAGKPFHQEADKESNRWWMQLLDTKAQINYEANDRHSMGLRYGFMRIPRYKISIHIPSAFTLNGDNVQSSVSDIRLMRPETLHTANIYYCGKIGNWQLDVNLDGVWKNDKNENTTSETITPTSQPSTHERVSIYTNSSSDLYAARSVAELPMLGGKLSFGTEYSYTRRREINVNPKAADGNSKVNEQIYAGFAEFGCLLFNRLAIKAGVRYEKVCSDYFEYGHKKSNREYDDLFPSLGLSMSVGKSRLSAHYGIDIDRPNFSALTNDVIYINAYTYQSGNPELRPTYTHRLSFSFTWQWLSSELTYTRIKDDIQMENRAYTTDNPLITLFRASNMPSFSRLSANVYAQPKLFGMWHPTWGVVLMSQDFSTLTADGTMRRMDRPLTYFVWNNILTLPRRWCVSLDAAVQTTGDYSCYFFSQPLYKLCLRVQRTFLNDRLDAAFSLDDITASASAARTAFSYRNFYRRDDSFTTAKLVLTYRFNVAKDKYKGGGSLDKQRKRIG